MVGNVLAVHAELDVSRVYPWVELVGLRCTGPLSKEWVRPFTYLSARSIFNPVYFVLSISDENVCFNSYCWVALGWVIPWVGLGWVGFMLQWVGSGWR